MIILLVRNELSTFHDDFQNLSSCPVFKEILPDGYCSQIFHSKRSVLQPSVIIENDKKYRIFEKLLYLYKDLTIDEFMDKLQFFLNIYLDDCPMNATHLNNFKESIPRISTKNLLKCINKLKWFLCHIFQPICIHNAASNEYIYSPICQESCLDYRESKACIETVQFFNAAFALKDICPNRFENHERFNCSYYPTNKGSNKSCQLDDTYIKTRTNDHRLAKRKITKIASLSVGGIVLISIVSTISVYCYRKRRKPEQDVPYPYNTTEISELNLHDGEKTSNDKQMTTDIK